MNTQSTPSVETASPAADLTIDDIKNSVTDITTESPDASATNFLSVEEIKQHVSAPTAESPDAFAASRNAADRELIELQGRKQFFDLRGLWSWWLIAWITGLLIFHVLLTVSIGLKKLDFETYQWFLPMVVLQNFLQIVGMGYIIVKFLYPGSSTPDGGNAP